MVADISPALKPHPTKLIVETTTRCNLKCPMCVKNTHSENFPEADMALATFEALLPALPQAEVLVLNGIGEPLLHPLLEDFIRIAKTHMPQNGWVGFQSNGFMIDAKRAQHLVQAGLDRICLSIDAVDPEGFRLIRTGGEIAGVMAAVRALRMARLQNHAPLRIGIEFVLRKDNIHQLPAVIAWAGENGVDFALVTQLFPYHFNLADQAVYDANMDASVALFRQYRIRAEEQGLDLGRYRKGYMHYAKDEADERVTELVESLMTEALRRGVSVNINRLLAMDSAWPAKTAAAFEQARAAAARAGIDLKLPGIAPTSARRCEFVEEGCAFVSVDGGIHPCYFLWHRYCCYIAGLEKVVGPKRFGTLPGLSLLDIWNDPAFAAFRRNVLRYDYPFCFNCSFALCDYVQEAAFEQDCYINTEPCAACLWCMGVFQCMK